MENFFKEYKKELIHELFNSNEFNFVVKIKNNEILNNEKKITTDKFIFSKDELNKYRNSELSRWLNQYPEYREIIFVHKEEVDKIINSDHKNKFGFLASNKNADIWTDDFIDEYYDYWDADSWIQMSANKNILWSKNRIFKYAVNIGFYTLSSNPNIEIDYHLFETFYDKWSVGKLSSNPQVSKDPKLESIIMDHKDALWYDKELRFLYFPEKFKDFGICSNTGIYWTVEKYEKYGDKIDLWILARFGQLSNELIFKYGYLLNENRYISQKRMRQSDWVDYYDTYINGWENLMNNENQKIDFELINYLSKKSYSKICTAGSASSGTSLYEKDHPILSAIDKLKIHHRIDIKFEDFVNLNHKEIIDYFVFKESSFTVGIFNSIIKKGIVENQEKFRSSLFNIFSNHGTVSK
jgi:hypothetical protein